MYSIDKKSYRKIKIPSFWQDLFCRKVFSNGKVEAVDPTTFFVTKRTENYRKIDFSIISVRATKRDLKSLSDLSLPLHLPPPFSFPSTSSKPRQGFCFWVVTRFLFLINQSINILYKCVEPLKFSKPTILNS